MLQDARCHKGQATKVKLGAGGEVVKSLFT